MFITLKGKNISFLCLQFLSPSSMQWSVDGEKQTWICDMESCMGFWKNRAKESAKDFFDFLGELIETHLVDFEYCAALSESPWRSLLVAEKMDDAGLSGFVAVEDGFGRNILFDISLPFFFNQIDRLQEVFLNTKYNGYNQARFNQQKNKLAASLSRLSIGNLDLACKLNAESIRKRFGNLWSLIWQWCFEFKVPELFGKKFPYAPCKSVKKASVRRVLDYSISEWDHIEPILLKDLNNLCSSCLLGEREQIVSLEWRLTFADLSTYPVSIRFRHPHNLRSDLPLQRTALLQAKYAFLRDRNAIFNNSDHNPIDVEAPSVISWTLLVSESMQSTSRVIDIFGETGSDHSSLRQLENRLSVNLESFQLCEDWLPEHAYVSGASQGVRQRSIGRNCNAYMVASYKRPLYLYKKPLSLADHSILSDSVFLERVMDKWWCGDFFPNVERNYYSAVDSFRRKLWLCRKSSKEWYVHGIFA